MNILIHCTLDYSWADFLVCGLSAQDSKVHIANDVLLPSSTYLFTAGVDRFDFSLDHTQTHTTVGRTPLDEGSARRRDANG
jgi:hypothetical protein